MKVLRIVPNFHSTRLEAMVRFYREVFELEEMMNHGWIVTCGSSAEAAAQVSVANEGGSGTPVPALSIEVDDLAEALRRTQAAGIAVEYGPVDEPWGVRRFYVRDPDGRLVNVLQHHPD